MRAADNTRDYEEYLAIQQSRFNRKWGTRADARSALQRRFDELFGEIGDTLQSCRKIACMGIRNGAEYSEFSARLPQATVYGVDLGQRVGEVGPHCYQYDFHHLPDDWSDKFDLVFSNSLDHSFEPAIALKEWTRVVKPGGYLLIDFTTQAPNWADRFGFEEADVPKLFEPSQYDLIRKPFLQTDAFMVLVQKR